MVVFKNYYFNFRDLDVAGDFVQCCQMGSFSGLELESPRSNLSKFE